MHWLIYLCYAVLSVPYLEKRLTSWLSTQGIVFSCNFVTFPYGVSGQIFIVSILDFCLPLYFVTFEFCCGNGLFLEQIWSNGR